jgi:hypothetical protein
MFFGIEQKFSRLLPRSLKDRIPHSIKTRYYMALKKQRGQGRGTLSGVANTLRDLKTRPSEGFMMDGAAEKGWQEHMPWHTNINAIEINDSCNLNCRMCATSGATRKKGLMDIEMFEATIADHAARGTRNVNFHTIGDPIANKNLPEYLKILRKYKVKVTHFSTNALMLERHMDAIFEYRDVIFEFRPSIDGATKPVYEFIRLGGNWETLHRNLKAFAQRNAKAPNPFPVYVNSVITKENFSELAFIPTVYSYLGPPEIFSVGFMGGRGPNLPYFKASNYFAEEFLQLAPCKQLFGGYHVLKDGAISACCLDFDGSLIYGHVNSGETPNQAFNNDKIRSWRRAHLDRDVSKMPTLCQTCYIVDKRYDDVIDGAIQYYYRKGGTDSQRLQDALNLIGPKLKSKDFDGIMFVLESL